MWQLARLATSSSSGSTPAGSENGTGTTCGDDDPGTLVPPSKRSTWRRLYQERGVPLYWIIDPDQRVAEAWRPGDDFPSVVRDALHWRPEGSSTEFRLDLAELFRDL